MTGQDTEALLEQQKQQCVFCRIIRGEMESLKVYEDEEFLAILDIRPATKGHVLLMPKEHVPLLPLLPGQLMERLFSLCGTLAGILRERLASTKLSVFIASGAAAGQQAPHLIVHLIPREAGDGLRALDMSDRTVPQADTVALADVFDDAMRQMLSHLGRDDLLQGSAPARKGADIKPVPATFDEVEEMTPPSTDPPAEIPETPAEEVREFSTPNEALQEVLAQNPELRQLIIAEPTIVEEYVRKSEKLKRLFAGVNIKALSVMLRRQEPPAEKTAHDMTEEELFAFIDGNEGLRRWLLENPEELAANISQNKKLESFLAEVDIVELAKRYGAR